MFEINAEIKENSNSDKGITDFSKKKVVPQKIK